MTAQRLTIPKPEIELYEDGFDATDRGVADLGRKEDGKKLSDLVEKITEPMVIAVDAPWGAGKSVFLKCWVGEHIKPKYKRKTTTVYFDAFQHDFLDDPLVSIFKEVTDRIEKLKPETTEDAEQQRIAKLKDLSGKAKKYVPILGRAALRLAVGTAATEAIMDIENPDESSLDELLQNANSEVAKAIGSFWNAEETRSQAMNGFREYLSDLAKDQKLAIVVDELDRCRPDYALNLLEVIKHFFNVENVHFVLGVNLTELENSVRARYGAGVNAAKYLQKFWTLKMSLNREPTKLNARYFIQISTKVPSILDNTKSPIFEAMAHVLMLSKDPALSLRDINKIFSLTMLTRIHGTRRDNIGLFYIRALIIIIKISHPEIYERILSETVNKHEISELFNYINPDRFHEANLLKDCIDWLFEDGFGHRENLGVSASNLGPKYFPPRGPVLEAAFPQSALHKIATEELEVFQLPT